MTADRAYHRIRVIKTLLAASSSPQPVRTTEPFFDALDPTARFIELARVHLRFVQLAALTHYQWAEFLGLSEKRYRDLLRADDKDLRKLYLAELARRALEVPAHAGRDVLAKVASQLAYQNWAKLNGVTAREKKVGRSVAKTETVQKDKVETDAEKLEDLRVRCGLILKRWAVLIGTSENTYRRRIAENDVPSNWLFTGRSVALTYQTSTDQERLAATPPRPPNEDEIVKAEERVLDTYQKLTDALTPTGRSAPMAGMTRPDPRPVAPEKIDETALFDGPPDEEVELGD